MIPNIIYSHSINISDIHIDTDEVIRYMGADRESITMIGKYIPECKTVLSPKAHYIRLPLYRIGDGFAISDITFTSESLKHSLEACNEIILMSLSLGLGIDRLIASYSSLKPSAAYTINAIANTAIEAYADVLCMEINNALHKERLYLRSRFSPGYGDLPLSLQPEIIHILRADKELGIKLTQNNMMIPAKSVTALAGISTVKTECIHRGCEECNKKDCVYRRKT